MMPALTTLVAARVVVVEKSIKVEVRKCIYPILSRWDLASILK